MSETPLEPNAQNVAPDQAVNSDISATIGSKRTAVILIMSLIAVVAPENVSAKSQNSILSERDLNNSVFLRMRENMVSINWKKLVKMSWSDMEKKLETMEWPEIQNVLVLLSQVATDAKEMGTSGVGEKIVASNKLNEDDKAFFVEKAEKYDIGNVETIKGILNKKMLTSSNFDYLLVKFKEILRKQRDFATMCTQVRSWLHTKITGSKDFNADKDFYEWSSDNESHIQKFIGLIKALKNYEESLSRNGISGSSSTLSPYAPYQENRDNDIKQSPKESYLRRSQVK